MVRKQLKFNTLNDLTGSEWLFFTNSIWETNVPPDATHRLRKAHGAIKPPQAMAELVRFFSRKGERVLDPFAGVGGILLGAVLEERRALGIEVERRWVDVFEEIKAGFVLSGKEFVPRRALQKEAPHLIGSGVCGPPKRSPEEQLLVTRLGRQSFKGNPESRLGGRFLEGVLQR